MAARFDRIVSTPDVLDGQPRIRGQRITVRRALQVLAQYPDRAERDAAFPGLTPEDYRQALDYAATLLGDEVVELERIS